MYCFWYYCHKNVTQVSYWLILSFYGQLKNTVLCKQLLFALFCGSSDLYEYIGPKTASQKDGAITHTWSWVPQFEGPERSTNIEKQARSGHKMDTDVLHIVSLPTSVSSCLALWDPSTSDLSTVIFFSHRALITAFQKQTSQALHCTSTRSKICPATKRAWLLMEGLHVILVDA